MGGERKKERKKCEERGKERNIDMQQCFLNVTMYVISRVMFCIGMLNGQEVRCNFCLFEKIDNATRRLVAVLHYRNLKNKSFRLDARLLLSFQLCTDEELLGHCTQKPALVQRYSSLHHDSTMARWWTWICSWRRVCCCRDLFLKVKRTLASSSKSRIWWYRRIGVCDRPRISSHRWVTDTVE